MEIASNLPSGYSADYLAVKTVTGKGRYFFVSMSLVFIVMAVIGFTPSYMDVYSHEIQLHWFAHVHGAIMASWQLLFLTQAILAARGNLRFHRQLGLLSVGWGVVVWLAMCVASIRARIAFPPPLADFTWDILLIEMSAMMMFGLFFTWSILVRKKPASHKRLLYFATLVLLQAAVDRMRFLPGETVTIHFFFLDLLIIPLMIYDLSLTKTIHRVTLAGLAIIVAVQFMVANSIGSPAWHQFWYDRYTPFVDRPKEVKLTDGQIDKLLGDYGVPTWHMSVLRDSGRIYLQLPDVPRFELKPSSENEWFMTSTTWRLSFIRSADGGVIKIVNYQPNKIWEANRLK